MTITHHSKILAEIVQWHEAVSDKPDADLTVMIIGAGEVEAYPGWFDGDKWHFSDGSSVDNVIYWADMLEGPLP